MSSDIRRRSRAKRWGVVTRMLIFLSVLQLASIVSASDNMRRELTEVAKHLKQLLDARGEDAIAVGSFNGPSQIQTSSGPAISKILGEELQKIGVSIRSQSVNLEVQGEYLDVEDHTTRQLAAMLKGRVLDRTGRVITEFERGIFGDAAIASIFGVTAQLPPDANAADRDRR